jgi:hypothetical protein
MGTFTSSWDAATSGALHSLVGTKGLAEALMRCGPLFRRSVLVVDAGEGDALELIRLARGEGARVTALCRPEHAHEARCAGADVVLDPSRTDPTWYRGAWSVIVDAGGRFGFHRAEPSLAPSGVYLTAVAGLEDRFRALLSRLAGGPRLRRA